MERLDQVLEQAGHAASACTQLDLPAPVVDKEAAARAAWLAKCDSPSWGKRTATVEPSSPPIEPLAGETTHVREMRTADTQQVADLRTAVFAPDLKRGVDQYLQARAFEEAMANKTATVVACAGDVERIVGSADMQMLASACGSCYVVNVCTHPHARRRGVARQLMEQIDARATELGARALVLHVETGNAAAIALYESLGFVRDERPPVLAAVAEFADAEAPQAVLVKPLVQRSGTPPSPRPVRAAVHPVDALERFYARHPAYAARRVSNEVAPEDFSI